MNELDRFLLEHHEFADRTREAYRTAFKALAKHTDKPFSLSREEMAKCLDALAREHKPSSWNSYVNHIRAVYKWLNHGEYPDAVKHIKLKRIDRADYVYTKILAQNIRAQLIRGATHPRDRALIAVGDCTGARRGELRGPKIGDLTARPDGYELTVTGKTGRHLLPPITGGYAKLLHVWLECHPDRDNPDAPLWPKLRNAPGKKLECIGNGDMHRIIKVAAHNAGLTRNVHWHMLRHTRRTDEHKRGLPIEAQKKLAGWSKNSSMPNIYDNLTDREAIEAADRVYNRSPKLAVEEEFASVKCVYCGEENPISNKACNKCLVPLDPKDAQEWLEERESLKILRSPEMRKFLEGFKK